MRTASDLPKLRSRDDRNSRSAISRKAVEASAEQLKQLQERRWENIEILVIYIDGQRFGEHHILSAVGVDAEGKARMLLVEIYTEDPYGAKDPKNPNGKANQSVIIILLLTVLAIAPVSPPAASVCPYQSKASGTQQTLGSPCSPRASTPSVSRIGRKRAVIIPRGMPAARPMK